MSHSQIRRETIQRGGTLDDAQAEIERTEGTSEARWCTCGDSTSVDAKGVCPVHGGESPAEPSVEQMIEEITKDGWILHGGRSDARPEGHEYVFWLTAAFRDGGTLLEDGPDADGATAMEALTNLHGAWRERE